MPIFPQVLHGLVELRGSSAGAKKGRAGRRSFGKLKIDLRSVPEMYANFKTEQAVKRLSRQEASGYQGASQMAEGRGMRGLASRLKSKAERAERQAQVSRRKASSVVYRLTSGKY